MALNLRRSLRTGPDYEAALRDGRQVYVDGTLIDDGLTFDEFTAIYFEKKSWRTETYRERVVRAQRPRHTRQRGRAMGSSPRRFGELGS